MDTTKKIEYPNNTPLKLAREFALKVHASQTYSTTHPYYKHLEDVYEVLIRFGFHIETHQALLVASFLHDTVEDTPTSYSDIKRIFGEEVAEIVYCVTDEMGRNRKEKKAKTYPKIRSNPASVVLKVADRIANAEFSTQEKSSQLEMYRKEYPEFEYHLRIHNHIEPMWDHLHKILFPESKRYYLGIVENTQEII